MVTSRAPARPRSIARYCACLVLPAACLAASAAPAQQRPSLPAARIIVSGEGRVHAAPDCARITAGATSRAKTAQEASEANARVMAAIAAALRGAGIADNDIQTVRFSLSPVYAAAPAAAPKRAGFSASNAVRVGVAPIGRVGRILDTLIAAGASEVDDVQFRHCNLAALLDQARQAAMADAERKARLYARAAGLELGGVAWISEQPLQAQPPTIQATSLAADRAVPIAPGEDTLRLPVTVGFAAAH